MSREYGEMEDPFSTFGIVGEAQQMLYDKDPSRNQRFAEDGQEFDSQGNPFEVGVLVSLVDHPERVGQVQDSGGKRGIEVIWPHGSSSLKEMQPDMEAHPAEELVILEELPQGFDPSDYDDMKIPPIE